MRSKSEQILADRLYLSGIPYHYEVNRINYDVYGDAYTVQPDFKILNKRTRQVFIWEHLGRLGDNDYCSDSLPKINDYIRDNLIPGKNLILSLESLNCPLDVQVVNTLIKNFLICVYVQNLNFRVSKHIFMLIFSDFAKQSIQFEAKRVQKSRGPEVTA